MNKKQILILIVSLVAFWWTAANATWTSVEHSAGSKPDFLGGGAYQSTSALTATSAVWDPPSSSRQWHLQVGTLLVEWLGIIIVGGGLLMVFKTRKPAIQRSAPPPIPRTTA